MAGTLVSITMRCRPNLCSLDVCRSINTPQPRAVLLCCQRWLPPAIQGRREREQGHWAMHTTRTAAKREGGLKRFDEADCAACWLQFQTSCKKAQAFRVYRVVAVCFKCYRCRSTDECLYRILNRVKLHSLSFISFHGMRSGKEGARLNSKGVGDGQST